MDGFNQHLLVSIEKWPKQRNAVQHFLFNMNTRRSSWEMVNLLEQRGHHGVKSKVDLLRGRLKTEVVQACICLAARLNVQSETEYDMMHIALTDRFKEDAPGFFQHTIA